jgi:hypothetical protein
MPVRAKLPLLSCWPSEVTPFLSEDDPELCGRGVGF